MANEEIEKVLEELHQVEPLNLNKKALRLFNAIMSIADERDLYKQRIDKAIEYIERETIDNKEYRDIAYIDGLNNLLNILKGEE